MPVPENPNYWTAIATVIPVIALTYATSLRRTQWHKMKPSSRRLSAVYSIVLVGFLAWSETLSLLHLQARSSSGVDEAFSLYVVSWAAFSVLSVPVAPLIVIAIHDLHPNVMRARRRLGKTEKEFAALQRRYDAVDRAIQRDMGEATMDGSNQVLDDLSLVFEPSGRVRPDYVDRVIGWKVAQRIGLESSEEIASLGADMQHSKKEIRRERKRLDKAVRAITKKVVKLVDMHE